MEFADILLEYHNQLKQAELEYSDYKKEINKIKPDPCPIVQSTHILAPKLIMLPLQLCVSLS